MKIFIANFGYNVNEEDLKGFFIPYGEVQKAVIIKKPKGRSRGFGFVDMPDDNAARHAIAELHEGKVEGKVVTVVPAKLST